MYVTDKLSEYLRYGKGRAKLWPSVNASSMSESSEKSKSTETPPRSLKDLPLPPIFTESTTSTLSSPVSVTHSSVLPNTSKSDVTISSNGDCVTAEPKVKSTRGPGRPRKNPIPEPVPPKLEEVPEPSPDKLRGRHYTHKCDYCDYTDYAESRLRLHMVKHTGLPPYRCKYCSYGCTRKFEMTDHMAEDHPAAFAKTITDRKEQKKNTYRIDVEEKPIKKVPMAIKSAVNADKKPVNTAISPSSPEKSVIQCELCTYKTDHLYNFNRHMEGFHKVPSKTLDQRFHCFVTKCRYKTNSKMYLENHVATKHPRIEPGSVPKSQMKRNYRGRNRFQAALNTMETQVCTICSYSTQNAALFKLHLQRKHPNTSNAFPFDAGEEQVTSTTVSPDHGSMRPANLPSTSQTKKSPSSRKGFVQKCPLLGCTFTSYAKSMVTLHAVKKHGADRSLVIPISIPVSAGIATTEDNEDDVPEKVFRCDLCNFQTRRKFNLQIHFKNMHVNSTDAQVDSVTRIVADIEGRNYACGLCDFRTRKKYNLKIHIIQGHSGTPKTYKCPKCTYSCDNERGIHAHNYRTHGERSKSSNALQKRKKATTGMKKKMISKAISKSQALKAGAANSAVFTCHLCSYTCRRQMWYTIHMRKVHNQIPARRAYKKTGAAATVVSASGIKGEASEDDRKPGPLLLQKRGLRKSTSTRQQYYACDECGYRCKGKYGLDVHKRSHQEDMQTESEQERKTESGDDGKPKYYCTLCKYWCRSRAWLTMHLQRLHQLSKSQAAGSPASPATALEPSVPLSCDHCAYTTTVPAIMKRHKLKHTGERPYECHLCDRKFAQKFNLTAHIKLHAP